jgi:hypothetical protein
LTALTALTALSKALELPGELPAFAPAHMLMVNLLGSVVCVGGFADSRSATGVWSL